MEGVVLLDNSVGVGTIGLDCLVGVGSHNISLDDLSIRDCTCWKRDHIYTGTVRWILHQLHEPVQCNLLALLSTYQRYVLVRNICYNFHLLYISTSQRTHKRSKIIKFIFKVRNTYLIYSFVCEVSTRAKNLSAIQWSNLKLWSFWSITHVWLTKSSRCRVAIT